MIRVRRKTRIQHLDNFLAGLQEFRDGLRILAVPIHPHTQGFYTTCVEVGVERRGDWPGATEEEIYGLVQLGAVVHDRPAHHIRVPADVLGGRVNYHVRAQIQWSLQVGAAERVVDDERGAGSLDFRRHLGHISNGQQRVGGGLYPDNLGVVLQRVGHLLGLSGVHHAELNSPLGEDRIDEAVGSAVGVVTHDEVIAGAEDGAQNDVRGGHSGGEDFAELSALECCDGLGQARNGGVGHASIFEASAQVVGGVLRECGGGVDGNVDGSHGLVWLVARVNCGGIEARVVRLSVVRCHGGSFGAYRSATRAMVRVECKVARYRAPE